MQKNVTIAKGQLVECVIESLAFGGQGVARINDFVIFVDNAIPGQRVQAVITRKKQRYAIARVASIISESPFTIKPSCIHFGSCGGCLLQNLQYEQQIRAKGAQVEEILRRLGGLPHLEIAATLPSERVYHYRNKMEFSFSRHRWLTPEEISSGAHYDDAPYLGLHARGFYDKVIDLSECHLIDPIAIKILHIVRQTARDSGLPAYSTAEHDGFWRYLIVRRAQTKDLMVNVVTSEFRAEIADELRRRLMDCPQITSLLNGVTRSRSSVAFCEEEHLLAGRATMSEQIGSYFFTLSANSFFQTNTLQARKLYDIVLEYAELDGDEIVYDLYCGTGTISIYLSGHVARVVGFEAVESAVINARENCRSNGIDNCAFVLGDLKDELAQTHKVTEQFGRPDIVILDPPRGGMHPKTVRDVLALQPKRIVHVSCNPTTMARELSVLGESYDVTRVQPVDMFPHTAHIEAVAQLIRREHISASAALS
ncbi:23S rRNA (uracil(1939)-C(5))-methyltransferase RlmD [candidate division KSB1 bacterium]|nr:23S rRNA (uracil(1939)-C(5))-methyltransferase RlmD [candidate division KSB1 bacterium]